MQVLFKPDPVIIRVGKPQVVRYVPRADGTLMPVIVGGATGDAMSDSLEADHLNFFFRGNPGGAVATPGNIFLALVKVAGTDASLGTEMPNAGNYSRTQITFGAPAGGVIANDVCTFPTASANWDALSNVVGWVICRSATYGNAGFLTYGTFSNPQPVASGNTPSIAAGSLTLTAA